MATVISDDLKADLKEDKEDEVIIYVQIASYIRICITSVYCHMILNLLCFLYVRMYTMCVVFFT